MVQHCDLKEFPFLDKKPSYVDILNISMENIDTS